MKNFIEIEKILNTRPEDLANTCGCSLSTYYRYRKGKASPDIRVIENLLEAYPELNTEWLFRGRGPSLKKDFSYSNNGDGFYVYDESGSTITFTSIPYNKLNSENPDSEGVLLYEDWQQSQDEYIICNNFIEKQVDAKHGALCALKVNSRSMEPTIPEGSLCLANTNITHFIGEAIYLIRVKEFLKLKVLQQLPDGKLRSSSQNSLFPPVEMDPDDLGFEIIGKVIWVGKKL